MSHSHSDLESERHMELHILRVQAWTDIGSHLIDLSAAFILAFPIGWNQEKEERSAGLRTFPLVALASCGLVLVASRVLGENAQSQARIMQGLITRIGFIGGGAILKDARTVRGTATAASIWNTGVLGAAVGVWIVRYCAYACRFQCPDIAAAPSIQA